MPIPLHRAFRGHTLGRTPSSRLVSVINRTVGAVTPPAGNQPVQLVRHRRRVGRGAHKGTLAAPHRIVGRPRPCDILPADGSLAPKPPHEDVARAPRVFHPLRGRRDSPSDTLPARAGRSHGNAVGSACGAPDARIPSVSEHPPASRAAGWPPAATTTSAANSLFALRPGCGAPTLTCATAGLTVVFLESPPFLLDTPGSFRAIRLSPSGAAPSVIDTVMLRSPLHA